MYYISINLKKKLPQRTKFGQDGAYDIEAVNVISDGLQNKIDDVIKLISFFLDFYFK